MSHITQSPTPGFSKSIFEEIEVMITRVALSYPYLILPISDSEKTTQFLVQQVIYTTLVSPSTAKSSKKQNGYGLTDGPTFNLVFDLVGTEV